MIISMKKFSCLLTFSPERKLAQIQSSTKAGRRFDNLTHAQKVRAENFTSGRRRRRISSSMLKVPNVVCIRNNVAAMLQRCVALKIVVAHRLRVTSPLYSPLRVW